MNSWGEDRGSLKSRSYLLSQLSQPVGLTEVKEATRARQEETPQETNRKQQPREKHTVSRQRKASLHLKGHT